MAGVGEIVFVVVYSGKEEEGSRRKDCKQKLKRN